MDVLLFHPLVYVGTIGVGSFIGWHLRKRSPDGKAVKAALTSATVALVCIVFGWSLMLFNVALLIFAYCLCVAIFRRVQDAYTRHPRLFRRRMASYGGIIIAVCLVAYGFERMLA